MKSLFDQIEELRRMIEMQAAIPGEMRRHFLGSPPDASTVEAVRRHMETVRTQTAIPEEVRRYLLEMSSQSASIMEGVRRAREAVSSLSAIPEEMRRHFLGFSLPTFAITEEARRNIEQVSSTLAVQADFSRLYDSWLLNPVNTLTDLVAAIDENEFDNVHIQSDGSVIIDGEVVTAPEMQDAIAELLDQPESFLRDMSAHLAGLRKPLRVIVSWFLKNVLAVFSIVLTLYLDNRAGNQVSELQRLLLQDGGRTRQEFQDAVKEMAKRRRDLSELRIVTNPVNVKAQRSTKARTTNRLPLGTLVRFLEKHREWVLIEYESPDTKSITKGWVYSKHLKRIE